MRGLGFCDEIVVVADRCTDRTQEIARQFGARVIDGIFPLESQRKTAGVVASHGEWILEIEPAESVDPALAYEVRAAIHGRPRGDWYHVPFANYVGDRLVRRGWGGDFGPASAPRLYRRRVKRWQAGRVRPETTLAGACAGAIETPLRRRADADVGQMIGRLDRQTALRAQDLADRGEPGTLGANLLDGLHQFWSSYLVRRGLREGEVGLLIALMCALDPILSGLRARELVRIRAIAAGAAALEAAQPTRISRTA